MRQILIGNLLTPYRLIKNGAILIENDRIKFVGVWSDLKDIGIDRVLDFSDHYIAPGFIDIHVHGGGGSDTMDASVEALLNIARTHAKGGTTGLYLTTLTAPFENILESLIAVGNAMNLKSSEETGAKILGAHVEGPYFNESQAGAQNPNYLRKPSLDEAKALLETGVVKRVSMAPELPRALDVARFFSQHGVLVSIAHSDATYQQVLMAIESGFSHVTHVFSGMSSLRRINSYRIAGVLEATLLLDDLTTEMIADGHHLPPSLMKLVIKNKKTDRVCGVTDAISAAGLGPGNYTLGGLNIIVERDVVDDFEISPEGYVAKLSNRQAFAGSVALMIDIVRNLVLYADLPITEAVKMVTIVPARIMGIHTHRGTLTQGKFADITVFDQNYQVVLTMVEGKVVYFWDSI